MFFCQVYNADIITQPHELHAKVSDIWYSQWTEQRTGMGHNTPNLFLLQFIVAREIDISFFSTVETQLISAL
jgi:hypothetical protein